MMAVYVNKGPVPARDPYDVLYHEGEPWGETAFSPSHQVCTPDGLELPPLPNGEVYTVVPCTMEPDKLGPFVLSVTADEDFTFGKDASVSDKPGGGGGGGTAPGGGGGGLAGLMGGMMGRK